MPMTPVPGPPSTAGSAFVYSFGAGGVPPNPFVAAPSTGGVTVPFTGVPSNVQVPTGTGASGPVFVPVYNYYPSMPLILAAPPQVAAPSDNVPYGEAGTSASATATSAAPPRRWPSGVAGGRAAMPEYGAPLPGAANNSLDPATGSYAVPTLPPVVFRPTPARPVEPAPAPAPEPAPAESAPAAGNGQGASQRGSGQGGGEGSPAPSRSESGESGGSGPAAPASEGEAGR